MYEQLTKPEEVYLEQFLRLELRIAELEMKNDPEHDSERFEIIKSICEKMT